jgi:hypothetical protein
LTDTVNVMIVEATSHRDGRVDRPRHVLATTALYWAVGFVAMVAFSKATLRQEFFFDEAWRADVARSADIIGRMRDFKTPLPPLWAFVLNFTSRLMPGRFTSLRLQGLALAALLPALAGQLARVAQRSASRTKATDNSRTSRYFSDLVGLVTVLTCSAMLAGLALTAYLNDYAFQGALVAALVLAWFLVDREWARPIVLAPILFAMAVGTMAGLFVLPAFAVWLWQRRGRRDLRVVQISTLLTIAGAGTTYLALYRHQTEPSLERYWAGSLFRHGQYSLLRTLGNTAAEVGKVLISYRSQNYALAVALGLVAFCFALVGLRVLHRWWPWFVRAAVSTWLLAVAGSIALSWPATVVRVNVPFVWLWAVAAVFGFIEVVTRLAQARVRFGPTVGALGVATIAVVTMRIAYQPGPDAFARGLDRDLNTVRASRADRIIVVAYHFMSSPYMHDGLVNNVANRGRYQFIQENYEETVTYTNLGNLLDQLHPKPGTEVWCVIPFEVGPDATGKACALDPARYEIFYNERQGRSVVIGARPQP